MKADTITKDYMSDTNVFADVFNYYIYGGQQVILPEQLVERDPTGIALPYGEDGKVVPVQKFRDVQKLYAAMTDGKAEYVLCGAENQTEIHYAMAVKNNLYDALDYAGQVEQIAKLHRKNAKQVRKQEQTGKDASKKVPNAGEFLGGFWKEDRLVPSVTVTIYFGCDPWDGPLSLFDMMEAPDPRILSCMDDYHVRLIAPALMSDDDIMKFRSSLREVMFFLKYAKDKEKLEAILKKNEKRFQEVERRAADVIEAITNTGLKYDEKEASVNMCQAILEMRMESEMIGEERGEQRGELRGERIGELRKAQEIVRNLYDMGLEVERIAQGAGYDVDTIKEWLGLKE